MCASDELNYCYSVRNNRYIKREIPKNTRCLFKVHVFAIQYFTRISFKTTNEITRKCAKKYINICRFKKVFLIFSSLLIISNDRNDLRYQISSIISLLIFIFILFLVKGVRVLDPGSLCYYPLSDVLMNTVKIFNKTLLKKKKVQKLQIIFNFDSSS